MPIRFRCQYCNQLLGIARRKAGTKVECPTCHAQLQVPNTEAPTREQAAAPAMHPAAPLFEHSDFDDFLRPQAEEPPAVLPPPVPPPAPESPPAYDVNRLEPAGVLPAPGSRPTPGIFLSPSQATLLTVLGVFLLAIAFGAGLLVGRYCF
jgi:phage FluMu protein Com